MVFYLYFKQNDRIIMTRTTSFDDVRYIIDGTIFFSQWVVAWGNIWSEVNVLDLILGNL